MKILSSLGLLSAACIFMSINSYAQEPIWDGNKVELVTKKLNDGVFAYYQKNSESLEQQGIPLATSGGFIVGDKGVVMIDTMLNKRLHMQARAFIKQTTDKPIIYAVNTSFHGDHAYGNMYLPTSTLVIQHQHTKDYIDQHFEADTQFMIDNFGKNRGIEEIVADTGDILVAKDSKLTLDLGDRNVDIIDFGFAQTGGDLFVWDPSAKVLWTGNPIITVKPSLPWLLDGHLIETLATLKRIYAFLPIDAQIVPGHGSVMQRKDILWHIQYLEAVKTQVQQAIDDGLTLEQTVEKVKMPEYSGYVLFNWVHPSLNIPAAYRDLTKK
ncbi:MBL fold metallo-hydrolase [Shewanella marina]|uniref:MBL fold metallo-hydrolase n=1 Tax=Shewanella marina TaxID=487319 RepID=UPI00047110E0|nr:MBL fold metallo-hydrolase [Shewanella marina]